VRAVIEAHGHYKIIRRVCEDNGPMQEPPRRAERLGTLRVQLEGFAARLVRELFLDHQVRADSLGAIRTINQKQRQLELVERHLRDCRPDERRDIRHLPILPDITACWSEDGGTPECPFNHSRAGGLMLAPWVVDLARITNS